MAAKQIRKKVVAAETESIEEQKPAVSAAEPAAEQVKPAPKAKKAARKKDCAGRGDRLQCCG